MVDVASGKLLFINLPATDLFSSNYNPITFTFLFNNISSYFYIKKHSNYKFVYQFIIWEL